MAINAYCGVMGSGKSYEVVSGPLLDAVAAGRRVVTNIDGVNEDLIHDYLCEKRGLPVDRLGSIVHVRTDDLKGEGFFPQEVESSDGAKVIPGFVRAGDFVVIDEAWKLWAAGEKITKEHMTFFRMHRHFTHAETGVSCDLVLMIQSIADLNRSIRAVVELSFRMVKLKSVGAPSRYRVEMYETGKQNAGTRIGTFIRRYQPEIFPLYKSYAGGAGVESVVDKRQNVLGRKSLWVLAGVVLLVGLSGAWFAWRFLHHGVAKSKGGAAASAASSVSAGKLGSAAAAAPAVASTPDVSEAWREVGRYSARGVSYVVLVGEKGRFRVESPSAFMGRGIASVGEVDGKRVTMWSGPADPSPSMSPAMPSLGAALPGGAK
ncbi:MULTISPECIES: zonular occludens toxin domain-containing protein [Paraburkholderia]|uniref:zonular occludens toxin domain-containing protein n=1 Tax=Paraburkholderia TaxID=1822464 RepID=UPI000367086E|nr:MULTISPECIES: zonular occludens toxin domain-containing protein [Paraburkholderia]MDH6146082.1 zona occludens toxin [Paraburkholderia sp. WSM4179]